MENKNDIPAGVKTISILFLLSSLGGLIFASIYFFLTIYRGLDSSNVTYLLLPLALILIGIFGVFTSINLWKGRNWARILTMIFLPILSLIPSYMFAFGAGFSGNMTMYYFIIALYIIVNIWIIIYLKKAKEFFE